MNLAQGEQQRPSDQDSNLRDANAIIWTLTIDAVPVYAIKPLDVFGLGFYASLILALFAQEVSPFNPARSALLREAERPDMPARPRSQTSRVSPSQATATAQRQGC